MYDVIRHHMTRLTTLTGAHVMPFDIIMNMTYDIGGRSMSCHITSSWHRFGVSSIGNAPCTSQRVAPKLEGHVEDRSDVPLRRFALDLLPRRQLLWIDRFSATTLLARL